MISIVRWMVNEDVTFQYFFIIAQRVLELKQASSVSECTKIKEYLLGKFKMYCTSAFYIFYLYILKIIPTHSCYLILWHRWTKTCGVLCAPIRAILGVILFSLNASPPLSLSRVINNGLSFVGFNAAATLHKAKLYPSWRILSATFYAFIRGSRARRRLLKRALIIALACP